MSESAIQLDLPDADVIFYEAFFSAEESLHYLKTLQETIAWEQQNIQMYGKTILIPRLTAWYGDEGKVYSYSGITHKALAWTRDLLEIRDRVEAEAGIRFNSVLLNQYRDQNDSISWHSDR